MYAHLTSHMFLLDYYADTHHYSSGNDQKQDAGYIEKH